MDTSLIFNIIAKDKTSSTFDGIKKASAVAGLAIGAVLMAGVSQAIEKNKIDAKLASQLGATPPQAAALGKLSGQVYAENFGEDMPAVAAAIKSAAQNGLINLKDASSKTAKAVTENLLTVGSVVEEDSSRVTEAVSQMMRTGMAKSSQDAMDMIVKATQNGVNKSGDLLDTLTEYPVQFKKLGISGQAALGLMSQAIKGGARSSDLAADALKEFSIRAVDGSKLSAQGFKALGLNAKDMTAKMSHGGAQASAGLGLVLDKLRAIKDPAKRSQTAVMLFGTQAEDLGDSLYSMNLGTATQQMGDFKGATGRAAATAQTGAAALDGLKRKITAGLVNELGRAVPFIMATFGWMQRNQSWLKPLAIGLGVIAIAIGVVTAAQWAWNAALAISPITWIIIGVVALVAVIVLVATKTRFFQTILGGVWGFMKGVAAWFAGPFANTFVAIWRGLVAGYTGFQKGIMTAVNAVKGFLISVGTVTIMVVGKVVGGFDRVVAYVVKTPGRMAGALGNMFSPLWNGFKRYANRIIGGWNSLHFGIPGFSFAGISYGGFAVHVPQIPYLARGAGMVQQSGLAVIHRGESVTPAARVTPYRSTGGGGGAMLTIKGDGSRVARFLLEILREAIRDKGGDPVKVLTPA